MRLAEPNAVRLMSQLLACEEKIITRTTWSSCCYVARDIHIYGFILAGRCAHSWAPALRIRAEIPSPLCEHLNGFLAKLVSHGNVPPVLCFLILTVPPVAIPSSSVLVRPQCCVISSSVRSACCTPGIETRT